VGSVDLIERTLGATYRETLGMDAVQDVTEDTGQKA
jgi:hypothetical protein